jgi:hypothetical protein
MIKIKNNKKKNIWPKLLQNLLTVFTGAQMTSYKSVPIWFGYSKLLPKPTRERLYLIIYCK